YLRRLDVWCENAPTNYQHERDLIAAELARLQGRKTDALALYQRAIEHAGRQGADHEEALAHERCARFHQACGDERMAMVHLNAGVDGYARWGAAAKVGLLQAEFPSLSVGGRLRRITTPAAPPQALDYLSLLKATETLTEELVLDRLLHKL